MKIFAFLLTVCPLVLGAQISTTTAKADVPQDALWYLSNLGIYTRQLILARLSLKIEDILRYAQVSKSFVGCLLAVNDNLLLAMDELDEKLRQSKYKGPTPGTITKIFGDAAQKYSLSVLLATSRSIARDYLARLGHPQAMRRAFLDAARPLLRQASIPKDSVLILSNRSTNKEDKFPISHNDVILLGEHILPLLVKAGASRSDSMRGEVLLKGLAEILAKPEATRDISWELLRQFLSLDKTALTNRLLDSSIPSSILKSSELPKVFYLYGVDYQKVFVSSDIFLLVSKHGDSKIERFYTALASLSQPPFRTALTNIVSSYLDSEIEFSSSHWKRFMDNINWREANNAHRGLLLRELLGKRLVHRPANNARATISMDRVERLLKMFGPFPVLVELFVELHQGDLIICEWKDPLVHRGSNGAIVETRIVDFVAQRCVKPAHRAKFAKAVMGSKVGNISSDSSAVKDLEAATGTKWETDWRGQAEDCRAQDRD